MVETDRGRFRAARLCCTLPLGVLKKGFVQFDPPLPPAKQQAIEHIEVGVLNKLYLISPHVFWGNQTLIRLQHPSSGLWAEWLNLAPLLGHPVLVGFNAGVVARRLERWSDAEIVASALNALRRCYGTAAVPQPSRYCCSRWGADPYSCGSYSFPKLGMTDHDRRKRAAAWGMLVFAGEATSSEFPATLQGAYRSGIQAAAQLLRWLVFPPPPDHGLQINGARSDGLRRSRRHPRCLPPEPGAAGGGAGRPHQRSFRV
jgi:monoamine oxidase